ncbi:TonB-dependent receptor plug domain-containing protein [Sphingopyxis sp.]|uniref:TonB-dependent receptor plug domain-containing protein n=1 Tax=Sphingopyxis sp. TaxID=1908224 RepID=UPI0035B138AF
MKLFAKAALGACVSFVALSVSGIAFAQEQSADEDVQATSSDSSSQGDAIVVTGSRIARPRDFTSPAPLVTIGADRLQQSGSTNLTDILTGYPALVGSTTSGDTSGDDASIGEAGLNLLNLRNLGTQRTLVLVDGRRHVSGSPGSQSVDINTIPSDLVERVEIVTGGASALYGADAVTGVVNFILKRDFEGLNARAQAGISQRGDSGQRLISVTAGKNFLDGRANLTLAYEYGEDDRLLSQQRSYLSGTRYQGFFPNPADTETGTQTNDGIPDRILFNDLRYFDTTPDGAIDVDFDGAPDFYGAAGLPFVHGQYLGSGIDSGGSGTPLSRYANDLRPDITRHVVNLFGRFEVSPALEIYAEGKYARSKTFTLAQPTFDYYLFVPEDNPFIPDTVRSNIIPGIGEAVFGPGAPDGVLVTRDNFDFGQRGQDNLRETWRGVIGARGDITSNLRYDLSYVYGRSTQRAHFVNDIYDDRFFAALDVVNDPVTGNPTCRVNVDPNWTPFQPFQDPDGARGGGLNGPVTFKPGECVPINLFGEGQSQEALDFIRADTLDRSKIEQHVVSAIVNGTFGNSFKLPGGEIGFAVGAEYRQEKSDFTSDPIARQGLTFTNSIQPTRGKFSVKEVFGEISLPILANLPFAERLTLGGAARYSDYSTIGSTTTWQINGEYAPIRDITFKGTYSRAIRAPNIDELFGGQAQTFLFITDPCQADQIQNAIDPDLRRRNCETLLSANGVADPATFEDTRSTNIAGFVGGNRNLAEERATIWTAGVALQPRFIPGLNVTLDWYDVKLKNAINTVTANQLAALCVDQPTLDNVYCDGIDRQNGVPSSGTAEPGYIVGFRLGPQNVAAFTTSGLDVNVSYRLQTEKAGTFSLRLIGNYLESLKTVATPGANPIENAGTSFTPKYQANADLTWSKGPFTINYGLSWFDKTSRYALGTIASNPDIVEKKYLYYKERWVHDIYASVDVGDRFQLFGGVNNFTDNKPGVAADDYPVSAIGRYFFVGAKMNLGGKLR